MTLETVLQVAQFGVTMIAFGGIVFGMGRLTERVASLRDAQSEMRIALFGIDGDQGAFTRRAEMALMQERYGQEREGFDRRLQEYAKDLGHVESRLSEISSALARLEGASERSTRGGQ